MTGFLLDTDVIINHLKDRSREGFDLESLHSHGSLHVSTLTLVELYAGLSSREGKEVEPVLSQLASIPVTAPPGQSAGTLINEYKKLGVNLTTVDAVIAATALEENLALVSHDNIFTKIKGLKRYAPPPGGS